MIPAPVAKLMVLLCLTAQVWVGCAPGGMRFCGRVVSESCCCTEVQVSEQECCCCEPGRPASMLKVEECGCCIGVPAVPVPLTVEIRADHIGALRLVAVLPASEPVMMVVVAEERGAVRCWRAPPDPGRARVAAGIDSTRLII